VTWLPTQLISTTELPKCVKPVDQVTVTIATIPVICAVKVTIPLISSTELQPNAKHAMALITSIMIWVTWDAQTVLVTKCGTVLTALAMLEQCGTTIPWCVKKLTSMTTNQREFLITKNQDLS
jgi:hypothetical protein